MVAILEIIPKKTRKERFQAWWKIEGKIESIGAVIVLIILIAFWDNRLVQGIMLLFGSGWCLGKIYFRKEKWSFFLIGAVLLFLQGISELFKYVRS